MSGLLMLSEALSSLVVPRYFLTLSTSQPDVVLELSLGAALLNLGICTVINGLCTWEKIESDPSNASKTSFCRLEKLYLIS